MDDRDSVLDAWSLIIVRDGWMHARIDAVAREAALPIGAVADSVPDRWDALRGLLARLERAALIESATDPDETVRNRLFAVIMAGFDAAQPQRALADVLAAAVRRDSRLALLIARQGPMSVRRVAEAAGVDTGGLLGPARIAVLAVQLARVLRTWLDDQSTDLAPTMKTLDTALAQAENLANLMQGRFRAQPATLRSADDHRPE
jgi:ubiquinone biosynthesis protein COQ9